MHSQTMKEFEVILRAKMQDMLAKCSPEAQDKFHKMYNHSGKHTSDVDGVPFDKLDWAFFQIERTLKDGQ